MNDNNILSDELIIDLYVSHNEDALTETERKYYLYLYELANNVLHCHEDTIECINDVYFLLWNHIPADRPQSFVGYLTILTRNCALNFLKKRNQKSKIQKESSLPLDELAEYLECAETVETEYDNKVLQKLFEDFVSTLDKRDRYIFECHYFCSDSVPIIANSLRISETAVYKRLTKMKVKLKKRLSIGGYYVK